MDIPATKAKIKISAVPKEADKSRPLSFWSRLGPGITTGAADDDPSGIATYSQTGARYGFNLLWLALFTTPLMATIQEMCARIGMVTGRGLAANIRQHYSRAALAFAAISLFTANAFNIGADLGAIAKAVQLLWPGLSFVGLIFFAAAASLALQIAIPYGIYSKYLKYLTFSLFSYVIVGLIAITDWRIVAWHTFVPSLTLSRDMLLLVCAILGTTISPYLFFWETAQEVEEEILQGRTTIKERQGATPAEIKLMRIDSWSGMIFSNAVMFFIIAACGATLNAAGITTINTAEEAALALKPLAGHWAYLLFTLGILGTGLLAIPVLAGSASYAIAEFFRWKEGLYRPFNEAYGFYGVIAASIAAGLAMNFVGLDPIKALLYAAVLNGLIAPFLMVFIVLLSSDKNLMGRHANGWRSKIVGWLAVILMGAVSLATIWTLF